MKMLEASLAWVLMIGMAYAAGKPAAEKVVPVGTYLQSISVNIKATSGYGGGTQGSGTVVLVPRTGPERTAFVLTAAHVVDGLRKVESVIGDDGADKKVVRYGDAQIVQEVPSADGSRVVGDSRLDAKVVCVDKTRDIALLRVRATGKLEHSAKFYLDDQLPPAGTELYHCGAPGGQETGGTASLTSGIVSRTGVRIPEFGGAEGGVYDQTDASALGGSSGGLLALKADGRWVGMITLELGGGDSFHWFVPIRNVQEWAEEVGVEWLLDEDGALPDEEKLKEIPLENARPGFDRKSVPDDTKTKSADISHAVLNQPLERETAEW